MNANNIMPNVMLTYAVRRKTRCKAEQKELAIRQKNKQNALANHKECTQPTVVAILKSPCFIANELSNNDSLARVMMENHYTLEQSYNAIFQKDIRDQVSAALIISNKPVKRIWACDFCNLGGFEDYNKAVEHEKACKKVIKN